MGGTGEVVWTLGPLVGVERPWKMPTARNSGKSVRSIDPIGSAGG